MRKLIIFFILLIRCAFAQTIVGRPIVTNATITLPVISGLITDFDFSKRSSLVITSTNKISQITDQVGSVTSSQATSANQPIFHSSGGPANNTYAEFDGGQTLTGALLTSNTAFTMVFVRRVSSSIDSGANSGLFQNGTTNGYSWGDFQGWVSGAYYNGVSSIPGPFFYTIKNKWEVVVMSHSTGNTRTYNTLGTFIAPQRTDLDPNTPTTSHTIGDANGMADYTGDIERILLYNRQLTDAEVITITNYLCARYNLPLPWVYNSGGDSIPSTAGGNFALSFSRYALQGMIPTYPTYLAQTAVPGRESISVLDSLNIEVINTYQPRVKNVYSLMVGHNDITGTFSSIDSLLSRDAQICTRVHNKGYKVILMTTLYTTFYASSITDTINNRIRAHWHTMGADTLYDIGAKPHFSNPSNTTYIFDGTHLTILAAKEVAADLEPIIEGL